ncbi:hypothetical protein JOF53_005122 [Crossiella equi]|uniref:Uncharacterized protein n=1 Tax=Crossiella equi TaxID=130796 RepID=A0ABS5AI61_9PSEU|nr:hypothetical protein [Crossiella equi]MBP2476250.1 hypothetical protein [Crossiella equi]
MADLIRQQPCPVRIPPREAVETEEFVDELLGEETTVTVAPPQPVERTKRSTRLIGLLVGAVVLTGSVAAASAITSNTWTAGQPDPAPVAKSAEITGPMVLRPDLLTAELSSARTAPRDAAAPPVAPPQAALPSARPGADTPLAVRPQKPGAVNTTAAVPPAQRAATTQPPVKGMDDPAGLVREFYSRLDTKPEAAAELLTPNLIGDLVAFVRSWTDLRQVRVADISVRPDGAVLAVVDLQQPGGGWMHTEQLLRLTKAVPLRITGAELLSAQHG